MRAGADGALGERALPLALIPGRATKRRGDFSIQRRRAEREIDASRFSFGPASYFNRCFIRENYRRIFDLMSTHLILFYHIFFKEFRFLAVFSGIELVERLL